MSRPLAYLRIHPQVDSMLKIIFPDDPPARRDFLHSLATTSRSKDDPERTIINDASHRGAQRFELTVGNISTIVFAQRLEADMSVYEDSCVSDFPAPLLLITDITLSAQYERPEDKIAEAESSIVIPAEAILTPEQREMAEKTRDFLIEYKAKEKE